MNGLRQDLLVQDKGERRPAVPAPSDAAADRGVPASRGIVADGPPIASLTVGSFDP
jgi:hypothetical protein